MNTRISQDHPKVWFKTPTVPSWNIYRDGGVVGLDASSLAIQIKYESRQYISLQKTFGKGNFGHKVNIITSNEFYPNQEKKCRKYGNNVTNIREWSSCTDFYETCTYSATPGGYLLHRFPLKSVTNCRKYGKKSLPPKCKSWFSFSLFSRHSRAQDNIL